MSVYFGEILDAAYRMPWALRRHLFWHEQGGSLGLSSDDIDAVDTFLVNGDERTALKR